MIERPPCWPDYGPPPNACAATLYRRVVWGHEELNCEWTGWRLRGRHLVSPHGERITPQDLDRYLYRRHRLGWW